MTKFIVPIGDWNPLNRESRLSWALVYSSHRGLKLFAPFYFYLFPVYSSHRGLKPHTIAPSTRKISTRFIVPIGDWNSVSFAARAALTIWVYSSHRGLKLVATTYSPRATTPVYSSHRGLKLLWKAGNQDDIGIQFIVPIGDWNSIPIQFNIATKKAKCL